MALSGSGRGTAVLCAAVVLFASAATPAAALPAMYSPLAVPASPEIPSPEDIAAAKASESATADEVTRIEGILADAATSQQAAFAVAMQANNSYSEALVELQQRTEAASVASAKAASAREQQDKTRKQVGQLAGDLYRNGGLNPTLGTLASGGESMQQAATLEALSASRSRAFDAADAAATAYRSLTAAADDATKAAADAATTAEQRKSEAEQANAAQVKAVSDAKAQRTVLVDQLAQLRNTTAALESARVDALDRQREEARLAALSAAADKAAQDKATQDTAAQNQGARNQASPQTNSGQAAAPAAPAPAAPAQAAPPAPAPAAPAPADPAPAPAAPAPVAPAPAPAPPADPAPAPAPPAPAPVAPAPAPAPAPSTGSGTYDVAISVALGKVGAPYYYQWGGTGVYGFDCSGLVQNAFAAAGTYLPRTASQQYAAAPVHVPISQARRGDLLVWGSAPNFYHVAIYLGNGQVVQALNPQEGITVSSISSMVGMDLYPYAARY
ncbi:C40 family peptidase [Pseudarthrobacter enclensis]|uniref:Cell wall-associated NlpC family hydrolase n=1 Tax=Pseudarthrobacter enclensis TaxID=993070 RepID=A0ABT9RTG7_9MICC|nr:C40 family peptidase [Pseudarthrobacter enclensis]MDP9888543.1 cell wall-associated NlpC family hydrolase [Pseudarthrobacter enclensis]